MAYALFIHGMGSGAKMAAQNSLAHYLPDYEWLAPELPIEPADALALLQDYTQVFSPTLIAGVSLGGVYQLYLHADIKVAINPACNIATVLRRHGYGRHPFLCPREDGATHYTIDEPLVQRYSDIVRNNTPISAPHMIALFSTDDELLGRETSKQNARTMQQHGYLVEWTNRCGHRLNQHAAKQLASLILQHTTQP